CLNDEFTELHWLNPLKSGSFLYREDGFTKFPWLNPLKSESFCLNSDVGLTELLSSPPTLTSKFRLSSAGFFDTYELLLHNELLKSDSLISFELADGLAELTSEFLRSSGLLDNWVLLLQMESLRERLEKLLV
ncbi:hypothetical protein ACR8KM_22565, partial [Salmonella enterica subsp. enterica serovar Paratyphi A]